MNRLLRDAPLMCGAALAVAAAEAPGLVAWMATHHPNWLVIIAHVYGAVSVGVTYWNRARKDPIGGLSQEAAQVEATINAAAATVPPGRE